MTRWRDVAVTFVMGALVVTPSCLLYLLDRTALQFNTYDSLLKSLAKISAFTAIALLALNVMLSARNRILDRLFGGLDRVYALHHRMGLGLLIFVVMHPMFLATRMAAQSVEDALLFLVPDYSLAVDLGRAALAVTIVVLALTVSGRIRYHVRKNIHQVMGITLLMAAAHASLAGTNMQSLTLLSICVLGLAGLAIASYFHTTFAGNVLITKSKYVVTRVSELNSEIVEIVMAPIRERIQHMPGQFIIVRFLQKGLNEPHPFSVCSSAGENDIRIAVKALGDFTELMDDVDVGTVAVIEGPYGGFTYKNAEKRKQIWIAGGIGITPFMSMARTLRESKQHYDVDLYYSFRDWDDGVFVDELREIAKRVPSFEVFVFPTSIEGRLDGGKIASLSGGLEDKEVFICGPKSKMKSLRQEFTKMGAPRRLIHTEEFKLL